jgi:hypothetical protein
MNSQPHDTSRPDRIRDLLRKLQSLVDDPAASQGERDTARSKLRSLMERHQLTDADLLSDRLRPVTLNYDHKDDLRIVLQVVGEVLDAPEVKYTHMPNMRCVSLNLPAADCADLMEAWSHYRAIVSTARQAAQKRQRTLRAEAAAIGKGFSLAFIQKYRIYPPNDPRPKPKQSAEALRRMMDAYAAEDVMRDVEGEKWTRKAGYVAAGTPQLTAG